MRNQKSNVSVAVHDLPFLISLCCGISPCGSNPLRRLGFENGGFMNLAGKITIRAECRNVVLGNHRENQVDYSCIGIEILRKVIN